LSPIRWLAIPREAVDDLGIRQFFLAIAFAAEQAVIAGHDWGAPVGWHAALLRPDRFRAVIALSVPFRPRGPVAPTSVMPRRDDAMFYQLYFQ
jgi:pimeloyl-ACP methyl ester carboxylesterase